MVLDSSCQHLQYPLLLLLGAREGAAALILASMLARLCAGLTTWVIVLCERKRKSEREGKTRWNGSCHFCVCVCTPCIKCFIYWACHMITSERVPLLMLLLLPSPLLLPPWIRVEWHPWTWVKLESAWLPLTSYQSWNIRFVALGRVKEALDSVGWNGWGACTLHSCYKTWSAPHIHTMTTHRGWYRRRLNLKNLLLTNCYSFLCSRVSFCYSFCHHTIFQSSFVNQ